MLRTFIRCIVAITWLVAVSVSLVVVAARSDDWPLPAPAIVLTTDWSGEESAEQLRAAIESFARDRGIAVGQMFESSDGVANTRVIFLSDPSDEVPADRWFADGIGNFGGVYEYEVRPFAELEYRSPEGLYTVFGSMDEAFELQQFLATRGLGAEVSEITLLQSVPSEAWAAVAVTGLLTAVLAGVNVVAGARRYAVERLHGWSFVATLRRDGAVFLGVWAVSGAVVCGAAAAAALAAFGTSGLQLFMTVIVAVEVSIVLTASIVHGLVIAILRTVPIAAALKGNLPSGWLTGAAYGLRVASAVLVLTTLGAVFGLADDLANRDRVQAEFDRLGDLSTVTYGNINSESDDNAANTAIGSWLRALDSRGELLLSQLAVIEGDDVLSESPELFGAPLLTVNTSYLARESVTLAEGQRLASDSLADDAVTFVVPESLWATRASLPTVVGLEALVGDGEAPPVVFERAADGQTRFTFAPDARQLPTFLSVAAARSSVRDPVIMVMPSKQGWIRDVNYVALLSQGAAMVDSPAVYQEAVRSDLELANFLRAAEPVREKAAIVIAEVQRDLRAAAFSAGMGCAVILVSGIAAALVYARRIAQRALVRHIHGWPLAAIYRPVLVVEILLLIGAVAWFPWQWLRDRQQTAQFEEAMGGIRLAVDVAPPAVAEWLAAVFVIVLLAAGFGFALVFAHRRIVKEGATTA